MKAFQSISSCKSALWKILFGHIILSGGTGTCSGLRFRMQRELLALVSPTISMKVRSPLTPRLGASSAQSTAISRTPGFLVCQARGQVLGEVLGESVAYLLAGGGRRKL